MEIVPITPAFDGFDALREASIGEGHRMLVRLQENWVSGLNRFDRPGEILAGAIADGALAGVCGRNIDPFADNAAAGRVRILRAPWVFTGSGKQHSHAQALFLKMWPS